MLEHPQALCVVNLREHATTLFDELSARITDRDALFHLSTRMCAAHRLQVIATIRDRLKEKLPCIVVSTQLIEAGVDLDFPVAFRALGPLDSIVQVAGRADREGLLTAEKGAPAGILVVFKPVDPRTPPNEYALATGLTETLALANSQPPQPDDLQALETFFENYYGTGDLGEKFLNLRERVKFKTLSDEFEMISSRARDVFVPFGEGRELLNELRRIRHLTGGLRRKLQRYTVGLQPYEFEKARNGVLMRLDEENDIWTASDAAYSKDKGLRLTLSAEALIG
jgi:CRISPR-associated endonuclease/helicase Cas3